jgi:hypothetical protein
MDEAKRTLWAAEFLKQLDTLTTGRTLSDYSYSKDAQNAKQVKLIGVVRPTVNTYTPGSDITIGAAADDALILNLDQYKYIAVELDDVDKAQSKAQMEDWAEQGSKALADEADKYVNSLAQYADYKSGSTDISTAANTVVLVTGGVQKLYENNVPTTAEIFGQVNPEFYVNLRSQVAGLDTNNSELLKRGILGRYMNTNFMIDNQLYNDGTDYYNMLRTKKAIAYVEQLNKIEFFKPEKRFSEAVKVLMIYGAKITRPKELYVMLAH